MGSAEVLQKLLENSKDPLGVAFARWKMTLKWEELVGPTLGAVSKPFDLRYGVLKVNVKSAAWLQQIQYSKADLLEALTQKVSHLNIIDIQFFIGNVD